jgi:hypothetical protein
MESVTARGWLLGLVLGAALVGSCGYFRPADPEPPSGNTVIPNYETPEDVLETLALAVADKGLSNGLSAYIGGFADTLTDLRGFHGFFDPATLQKAVQNNWTIPDDWNRVREEEFYGRLVKPEGIPANSDFFMEWDVDPTQGEDEPGTERQVLHREYLVFATLPTGGDLTIAQGFATLEFIRVSPSRWVIVRWQDREDPTAVVSEGEVAMGYRRLDGSE